MFRFLTPKTDNGKQTMVLIGVAGCFLLSGFAALLYQTAWMRQFSVVFGTSELAIATVLSSYMAGLALGAAVAGRYVHKIKKPVLIYGILEATIAVSALAVPYLLKFSGLLYALVLGGQTELPDASGLGQSLFYLLVAFLVLLIPTASMGATLPLLTKYVVMNKKQIGSRVGMLYAINTFGAIGGTLVAAFYLLPLVGLEGTVWVGVGINFLIFFLASSLAKSIQSKATQEQEILPTSDFRLSFTCRNPTWVLPIMLMSGANTFTYEVLWTRLLSHILGGSITAFATMLASFLGGIALGSAIASRVAKTTNWAFYGFVVTQIAIAITSAVVYYMLDTVAPDISVLESNIGLTILILLPATLFIGATFPFAVRLLAHDETDAARSSAQVYAWNTFGAIVGAAIAGFILIPILKYEGTIKMAVCLNLGLAFMATVMLGGKRSIAISISAVTTLAAVIFYQPQWPEQILRISPLNDARTGEIRFYDVGRTSTVMMIERDGYFYLRNNGLSEASINLKGAPPSNHNQVMLSTLPVLARPEARDMLVIGFGGGVIVENAPESVTAIDVLELEPKVIEANRAIAEERKDDPFKDPRVNIVINDARSALHLTEKKYDIIISQPSHPWTAGASHLYTREFMQLAHKHLTDDGVFLQWMNINFVNTRLLRSLCQTLLDVFPYVRVYYRTPNVFFFLGSDEPLEIEKNLAATGIPLTGNRQYFLERGVSGAEDLLLSLVLDDSGIKEFVRNAPVITDDVNLMATHSIILNKQDPSLPYKMIKVLYKQYSPLLNTDSWVYEEFPETIKFPYISNQLKFYFSWDIRDKLAEELSRIKHPQALGLAGSILLENDKFQEGRTALLAALKNNPDDQQSRFVLMWLYKDQLSEGTAPAIIADELDNMLPSSRAVLEVWLDNPQRKAETAFRLDNQLAQTKPTDLWYLPASKMRADWRIQRAEATQVKFYAEEALRIVDDAITLFLDIDFFGMRIAASFIAEKPLDAVETFRRMIMLMSQDFNSAKQTGQPYPENRIETNIKRIQSIARGIKQLLDKGEIQRYKVEDIRLQVNVLLKEYQETVSVSAK